MSASKSLLTKKLFKAVLRRVADQPNYPVYLCHELAKVVRGTYENFKELPEVQELEALLRAEGHIRPNSSCWHTTTRAKLEWLRAKIDAFPKRKQDKRDRRDDYLKRKARAAGLTKEEARLAVANMDEHHKKEFRERKSFDLLSAFVFMDSPQGSAFWWNVDMRTAKP
jgi:hypothetical protein